MTGATAQPEGAPAAAGASESMEIEGASAVAAGGEEGEEADSLATQLSHREPSENGDDGAAPDQQMETAHAAVRAGMCSFDA